MERPRGYLLDLLMATMNSIATWTTAAGDPRIGLQWRDRVTEIMIAAGRYRPYEELVARAARALELDAGAPDALRTAWPEMEPWPDADALDDLDVPYAFVTNCSEDLARIAVERSGRRPAFTLSAESAGWFKPRAEIYRAASGRMGLRPSQVRFIAGAPYDALGASNAGLHAVLVARRALETPMPDAVPVVRSLDQALALDPWC
ncbi:MAG TPA: HAD-IA family hydrolase [Candidatus Limnocylindria bacterium]|nr:HAD-IA family hydrolase [Candidatus Limnocylindria bacterium]